MTPSVSFPYSLVEPLPVSVGIYYDEAFRRHHLANTTPKYSNLVSDTDILTGRASVDVFDRFFSEIFMKAVPVEEKPPLPAGRDDLDAVVEAEIQRLTPGWREDGLTMTESVTVVYAVTLYSSDGAQVRSWIAKGEGHTSQMTGFSSLEDAAANAMRDAGARLMVAIYTDPSIKKCLQGQPHASGAGREFLQCIAKK